MGSNPTASTKIIKKPPINKQIRGDKLRVINEEGKNLGVFPREEALKKAKQEGLDLVLITGKAKPPVCKIIDAGKYLYQQKKKEKKKKKKAKTEMKQIRLGFNISSHDLETKVRETKKFLEENNKVKVLLQLRGREKALGNHAKEKIEEFLEKLKQETSFRTEKELKRKGGRFTMILSK